MAEQKNERELNARERKRVYMHSTIFDSGGPTSKSIYAHQQQNDIYAGLGDSLRKAEPPSMALPRPSDIQCTQNAGHGVVMPSDIGVDRRGLPKAQPKVTTQRTSGPEVLVTDGDPMPVTKAGNKDEMIPQEFWQTNVNLQWHDPRNEMSRQNKNRNTDMGAQELKLQELSSEIFGKARIQNCSTSKPGADLLSSEADYLQHDSALNPNLRLERRQVPLQERTSYGRKTQNLADSNQNTMSQAEEGPPTWVPEDEDPSGVPRRRQEKNFSDLFGTQMGERKGVQGREEVNGTRTCSFLDTRSEIATRNKDKWRPGQSDVEGTILQERTNVSSLRKEAEQDSHLFGHVSPQKPRTNTEELKVTDSERVCWDTRDIMQHQSELARRSRLKEFSVEGSAQDRKWVGLASKQVRRGLGGYYDEEQPQFSPRGGSTRGGSPPGGPRGNGRLTDPRAPPASRGERARASCAKDTKLASLQSSIFD